MKKISLFGIAGVFALMASLPLVTRAQMMGNVISPAATAQIAEEEATGKATLDKLQSNQTSCSALSSDDFEKLGDYFMGRMMGNAHATMDALMTQRIGENNNSLMHIALGKRLSGCDTSAVFPAQGSGFLPMMGMMGGWSSSNYPSNGFGSMMGYGGFGWSMALWWILIIVVIVLVIRWMLGGAKTNSHDREKNALDILKNRYAKGEIDKKEYEDKKRDLIS